MPKFDGVLHRAGVIVICNSNYYKFSCNSNSNSNSNIPFLT